MATFKEINHDSGPPVSNHYTTVSDFAGRASITAASALNGTAFGLAIVDDTVFGLNLDDPFTPPASNQYNMRVRHDPNGLNFASAGNHQFLEVETIDAFNPLVTLSFFIDTSSFTVTADLRDDNLVVQTLGPFTYTDAEHCFELRIIRSSAAATVDGSMELLIDTVSQGSQLVEYFNQFVNANQEVRVTAFAVPDASVTGTFYTDEILFDDVAATNLCVAAGFSLASMTKPVDIDADGTNIYIGLLDSGNPILIKFPSSLALDGTTVFNPGSGTDIGVQCGREDADTIWIAGDFGGTDTVEKSEDAGTSFTVKDPATFGAVSAFAVGPDSDERVLIVDDGVDIQETIDDGGEWIAKNTGLTPVTKSLARLDINVEEVTFGNESSANDNVDYSINTGADLEDLNLPVAADVNDIIVN